MGSLFCHNEICILLKKINVAEVCDQLNKILQDRIDGSMQNRHNSITNSLNLYLFIIKPSKLYANWYNL